MLTMKYLLLFLVSTQLFIACTSKNGNTDEGTDSATNAAPPALPVVDSTGSYNKLDTALSFAGVWVNEDFVNDLHITQSPAHSPVKEGISCIVIPARTLISTSPISGFYEGSAERVVVKDGDQYLLCNPDLKNGDTIHIDVLSPTRIKIQHTYLYKLMRGDKEMKDYGILEELLFSGNYKTADGKDVVLGEDGTVSGLDIFTKYEPNITPNNLYREAETDVDYITFTTSKGTTEEYGYKFKMDTLSIYKIKCLKRDVKSNSCYLETYGDKVFELIKGK